MRPRRRVCWPPPGAWPISQYLSQSLVLALVFTGYGFGLYDRVGTVVALGRCWVLLRAQLVVFVWLMGWAR